METAPTIRHNLRCRCGYNLRALTYRDRCPECGRSIFDGARHAVEMVPEPLVREIPTRRLQLALERAASKSKLDVEALWLLMVVAQYAWRWGREDRCALDAKLFCAALREFTFLYFGGEAAATTALAERGIQTSEDVRRGLLAISEAGAVRAKSPSNLSFAGLFKLDNLFQAEF